MDNGFNGLSEEEVLRSRAEGGSNELAVKKRSTFISKFIKNLGDPIIRVLIVAFVVTLFMSSGGIFDSLGIAASVLISTLVSTLSEYGSEKAFRKMQQEASLTYCEVIRGGKNVSIPVSELVRGDIVSLRAGDKIGADGVLMNGNISVDTSAVNGESAELQRSTEKEENILHRGCFVTAGKGVMRVSAVGAETYYGKIADEVQEASGDSPLREKLTQLAKTLSVFGYFCAAAVAVAYLVNVLFLAHGFVYTPKNVLKELMSAFTLALSVVVVAVPEGLPMMITVVLSSNMVRLQRQSVRVRRPVGIETAGSIDVLFTDKTGTLTYGVPKTVCYVTGNGVRSKRSMDMSREHLFLLGACAVHAGESKIESLPRGKRKAIMGESADRALLSEYLESGAYPKGTSRKAFLPFDSKIKMSAASIDISANREMARLFGEELTVIKGAPEIIIKYCEYAYGKNGEKLRLDKISMMQRLESMTEKGMRVLAVATSCADSEAVGRAAVKLAEGGIPDIRSLFERGCFLCFVGIRDELRSESRRAVKTLQQAGIQTVMITGDAKGTAVAIAKECGILTGDINEVVLESEELKAMTDSELERILPYLRVVARALPDDKSRLVKAAKKRNRITAMTGDGLNDAAALKAADVGFAMGNGTEVAKEAADIIITDSNISSIEKAVLYGRTVFRSIRKFIVFQLIMNLSAVGISIAGPFIGVESPVTVIQMLWINLIMDTLAALAFAGEAPLSRYMKSPPIPKNEPVMNGDMLTRIFVMGVYTVTVGLYFLTDSGIAELFGGRESEAFMSGFFALFVFCGLFGAFTARSGRVNILSGLFQNPVFVTVIAAVFCAQMGMIYFGGELFRCIPLTVMQLKKVIVLALTVIPAGIALEMLLKISIKKPEMGIQISASEKVTE